MSENWRSWEMKITMDIGCVGCELIDLRNEVHRKWNGLKFGKNYFEWDFWNLVWGILKPNLKNSVRVRWVLTLLDNMNLRKSCGEDVECERCLVEAGAQDCRRGVISRVQVAFEISWREIWDSLEKKICVIEFLKFVLDAWWSEVWKLGQNRVFCPRCVCVCRRNRNSECYERFWWVIVTDLERTSRKSMLKLCCMKMRVSFVKDEILGNESNLWGKWNRSREHGSKNESEIEA